MRLFLRLAFLATASLLGLTVAIYVAGRLPAPRVDAPSAAALLVERPQHFESVELALEQPALDDGLLQPLATVPRRATVAAVARPRVTQRFVGVSDSGPTAPALVAPEPPQLAAAPAASPTLDGLSGLGDPGKLDQGISLLRSMAKDNPDMLKQLLGDKADPALLEGIQKLLAGQGSDQAPDAAAGKPNAAAAPAPAQPEPAELPAPKGTIDHLPGNDADSSEHLVINMQNEDIRTVLDVLGKQGGLNILASESVTGTVSAVLKDVDVNGALEAILKSAGYQARHEGKFIYVGTPQDFATMQTTADTISTRIYRPNYVSAKELQVLITPLLTASVGKVSVTIPSDVGIPQGGTTTGGDSFANGEAVLVQDYETTLQAIDQVVRELDKRPMQVSIEAMILSVKLNDENKFGVNLQALRQANDLRLGSGSFSNAPLNGTGAIDPTTGGVVGAYQFTNGGLQFAFLDSHLGAFLNALESIGDTDVIATPRLLCLNKQKAEILIGSQFPYQQALLTSTSTASQTLFQDYGTQLRLRPFIGSDGLIRMEVHPEISSPGQQGTTGPPAKNVTQVTTNIMCRDGCTVIIGGLTQEELDTTTTQIPFLGSLPYAGWIFRTKDTKVIRTEILVLVTPRIVFDPEFNHDSNTEQQDYLRRQQVVHDNEMSHGTRDRLSRVHVRIALAARVAGKSKKAAHHAELAISLDPNNREAIALRHELEPEVPPPAVKLGVIPPTVLMPPAPLPASPPAVGPNGAPGPWAPGPAGNPIDGERISPWLLDDLEGKRAAPLPMYPRDPGVPGYSRTIRRPGAFDDDQK